MNEITSNSFSKKTKIKIEIAARKIKEISKTIKNEEILYVSNRDDSIIIAIHKGGFYINRINTFSLPKVEEFEKIINEKIKEDFFLKLYELITDPKKNIIVV